jgi:4-amino-4-deoxy-L-arabinose transferase-like glycosyltransferase
MLKKSKFPNLYNYLIVSLLAFGAFIRVCRLNELLGFWYDQGRDALVVWNLIHSHKFFLIGPTTGLAGVFRGPWYYYLIAPFYWLGNGHPAVPAAFLALTTVVGIYIIYRIVKNYFDGLTALLFVLISSLSFYFLGSSRWLSNPTPMYLISALYLLGISKIIEKKNWGWYLVAFISGMAMQFGSAAEVFYIPAAIIFAIFTRKYFPSPKTILISLIVFALPFLPQVLFEFRHGFIITTAVINNFLAKRGPEVFGWGNFLLQRLNLYYDILASKIFVGRTVYAIPFLGLGIYGALRNWRKNSKNLFFKALLILVFTPFLGLIVFRGNYGNLYDYYFTGYYFPIVLLFSFILANFVPMVVRNLTIWVFIVLFLYFNLPLDINSIRMGVDSNTAIFLGNQRMAMDYIYKDAKERSFNVDVYVPPVIPYSYEYLFKWLGATRYHKFPDEKRVSLLYTLEEQDPDHPDRINAWYARQDGIGKVESRVQFGGITIERRTRYDDKF